VEKSRAELERLVVRYGATSFQLGWEATTAVVAFRLHDRFVRFDLGLPHESDPRFRKSKRRRYGDYLDNTAAQRAAVCAAEHRRRWRALLLVIKAKLEAVDSGITTFEEEFLAHLVVPGGKTFGAWAVPQIAEAYKRGMDLPPLLGGGSP
jgi:hypothetical protein